MKRILSFLLCLLLFGACLIGAGAAESTAPIDATEGNTGPEAGNAFFVFALIVIVLGGIYLFFKLKKRD